MEMTDEEAAIETEVREPIRACDLVEAHRGLTGDMELEVICTAQGILHPEEYVRHQHLWILPRFWGAGKDEGDEDEVKKVPLGLDDLSMTQLGQQIVENGNGQKLIFWSPRETSLLLGISPLGARELIRHRHECDGVVHVGFIWIKGHWLAFHFNLDVDGTLQARFYDGLVDEVRSEMVDLACLFEVTLGAMRCEISVLTHITQHGGHHCGVIAAYNLGRALGKWQKEVEEGDLLTWHKILLHRQNRVGHGPDHQELALQTLAELLEQKGVPLAKTKERARQAVKKLGLFSVQKALCSQDPWRALKNLGSHQTKPFQFVLYNELQANMESKNAASAGHQKTNRKNRGNDKAEQVLALVPDDLELPPKMFADPEGVPVPVIDIKGIQADARGVAIVTPEFALQLAAETKNMSVDALAVLTIGDHSAAMTRRTTTALQWSAIHKRTMEPVLITGTLLQLGDQEVHKIVQAKAPQMPAFDTAVVRIQVFRDSFTEGWDDFLRGPVKKVVQLVTPLQFCDDETCKNQCQRFHPAVEENVSTAVLDVWNWHWADNANRKCKMSHAETFSVHLRLPASGLTALLAYSGWNGIFMEPRPLPGVKSNYSVIWLSKNASFEDAMRHNRALDKVIGVARMGAKHGLRVLSKDETTILKVIYPNTHIKPCAVVFVYELGPLPFGISKDKVAELLAQWQWEARPLRPTRSSYNGKFWDIGAAVKPSSLILPTADGDVTLSLKKTQFEPERLSKCVQASSRTLSLMHGGSEKAASSSDGKGADAWMNGGDPWSAYKARVDPGNQTLFPENKQKSSSETQMKFQMLQTQVETLAQQLKHKDGADEDMKQDENTVAMEIEELKSQQNKYEQWFHSAGSRVSNMEGHMQKQAAQIQELGMAVQNQTGATAKLQQQMEGIQTDLNATLHQQFEAQNTRLEALLEKRAKMS